MKKSEKIKFQESLGFDYPQLGNSKNRSVNPRTHLEKKGSTDVQKDIKELESIAADGQKIQEYYMDKINGDTTLWFKLTNRSMAKIIDEERITLVKHSGAYRNKFYHALMETKLKMFEERCNAGIKGVGAQYRRILSSFLLEKFEEIFEDIRMRRRNFLENIKDDYVYAETLKPIEGTYQRYNESLINTELRFFRIMDSLLDSFEQAVNAEITNYSN